MSNPPTHHRTRTPIPIVSDLEALQHARSCVLLRQNHLEANPDITTSDPLDSRALSELDRLIDHAKHAERRAGELNMGPYERTQAQRIDQSLPLKHGPQGTGRDGPCEPNCLKCRREREAKS